MVILFLTVLEFARSLFFASKRHKSRQTATSQSGSITLCADMVTLSRERTEDVIRVLMMTCAPSHCSVTSCLLWPFPQNLGHLQPQSRALPQNLGHLQPQSRALGFPLWPFPVLICRPIVQQTKPLSSPTQNYLCPIMLDGFLVSLKGVLSITFSEMLTTQLDVKNLS